jgi:pimeloyl-ACP methyl ester carboxylesterase
MLRLIRKVIGFTLLTLVGVLAVAAVAAIGYRAYRQNRNAQALLIRAPDGIQESFYADIGGLKQWLQIRGEDRRNPVLLFVHGGPALSMIPFTYAAMRPWEKSFTVAQWDQRGAGRTYLMNGGADATATGMEQIIDDGVQVAELLRARLHQDRIILVGESWGSAVGLEMARRRPDLFYAFVGTGQVIDMTRADALTYQLLLKRVRAARDAKSLQNLARIGPPPYSDVALRTVEQQIDGNFQAASERSNQMGPDFVFAPGYSLRDSYRVLLGATGHRHKLAEEILAYNAATRGVQFTVPLFFFQGTDDIQTPLSLVEEYFTQLRAPRKELITFPGGGHNCFYYMSSRFLDELNARVRPLARASAVDAG